ncbi:MAG: UDP-glucose 6-dehydrogenase [Deltaproteobacteria bacterium]|jgi:UDP-N-acetyl-D-glucosamine dehydrogenase|nr:UDP-glucose 6-dehydrogenase [Deltaproteobacteria bacterium]
MNTHRKNANAPQPAAIGKDLEKKIRDRTARVGVIGLGYVGLPLTVEMAKSGFQVTGIDIELAKVEAVNAGRSCIVNVPSEILQALVTKGKIKATQSWAAVENLDAVSICVPTSIDGDQTPDLSYVIAAIEAIHNHLHQGQLIILESTIYPSTIRDVAVSILYNKRLQLGKDFFLAYSPERIDAGNKTYIAPNVAKVIGGVTSRCMELATLLYQQFIERIVPVCSPEAAEMVKLIDSTLRSVNLAVANEMALVCDKLGIDVWAVMEMAGQLNEYHMPELAISDVMNALNEKAKSLKGSKILALGVTDKRNVGDISESPAIELMRSLQKKGATVYYSDPHVPFLKIDNRTLTSTEMTPEVLHTMDCVLILTDHSTFNYEMIVANSMLILDKRNALKHFRANNRISSKSPF